MQLTYLLRTNLHTYKTLKLQERGSLSQFLQGHKKCKVQLLLGSKSDSIRKYTIYISKGKG